MAIYHFGCPTTRQPEALKKPQRHIPPTGMPHGPHVACRYTAKWVLGSAVTIGCLSGSLDTFSTRQSVSLQSQHPRPGSPTWANPANALCSFHRGGVMPVCTIPYLHHYITYGKA